MAILLKVFIVVLLGLCGTSADQISHELPPRPAIGPGLQPFHLNPAGPTIAPFLGPSPAPLPFPSAPQFFGPSPAPAIVPVPAPAPAPIHAFAEQEAEVVPFAARPPIPLAAPLVGLPPAPVPLLHRAPIGPAPIDYEEGPSNYAFGYAVRDDLSGDDFSHNEVNDGVKTTGEYRVSLPDGRTQIVSYVADENGYVADVKYEGNAIPYVPPVPVAHPAPLGVAPAPLPYPAPLPAPLIASPPVAPLAPLPPAAPLTPFLHSAPFVHSIPEGPADFSFQGFAPEPALPLTASPIPPSIGPLRHHAPMPDHPLPLPARPLAPLPAVPVDPAPVLEEVAPAVQVHSLGPAPVGPVGPEPVAVVHGLRRLHSAIPAAGYIPTPRPFGPTPLPLALSPSSAAPFI